LEFRTSATGVNLMKSNQVDAIALDDYDVRKTYLRENLRIDGMGQTTDATSGIN
jgi:hypothetical protein